MDQLQTLVPPIASEPTGPKRTNKWAEGALIGLVWLIAGFGMYGAARTIHELRAELAARTIDVEVETVQLANQNQHLQLRLEETRADAERLVLDYGRVDAHNKQLLNEIAGARTSVSEMTAGLKALQKQHEALLDEKVELQAMLRDLKIAKQQWTEREAELSTELQLLNEDVVPVRRVRENLERQIKDVRAEYGRERKAFQAEAKHMGQAVAQAQADYARLQARYNDLRQEFQQMIDAGGVD